MSYKKGILLTGVTGTLGKNMIVELLKQTESTLYLLVRSQKKRTAEERIRRILAARGCESAMDNRIRVLEGDVTVPGLGIGPDQLNALKENVESFFHIAALTALNGSEEDCFRINFEGTRNALEVAWTLRREGNLQRFYYFSTAFVAGSLQTYFAKEDGLPAEPAHANYYEASKYKAETRVREAMAEGLPVTIFRPSIVVGDSKTGEVSEFNVIYPFIRLFVHGMLTILPTKRENSFNIVPIDFVINAALHIAFKTESQGKTFHLVTVTPPTIGALVEIGEEDYPQLPAVNIIDPKKFSRESLSINEQLVFDMFLPYLGYLNDNLSFDVENTREALKGSGIEFPATDKDFLRRLIKYAVDAGYLLMPT